LAGILSILLVFSFVLVGCDNGSDDNNFPVIITTAAELEAISNNLNGNYILGADLDLSFYTNFAPIGAFVPLSDAQEDAETPKLEKAFTGVFDGNGHKISNVTISVPTQNGVGLFGCVADDKGVVENVTVTGGHMLVGGVIGYGGNQKYHRE
jgi:hypothetical protein